jgi:hypothetical protein
MRTAHVVDPLPETVRLTGAPGELRGVALRAKSWRCFRGELLIECVTGQGRSFRLRGRICHGWSMSRRRLGWWRRARRAESQFFWWPRCVRRGAQRSVKTEVAQEPGDE